MLSQRNDLRTSGAGGLAILGSIGLGAVLMYFLDPDNGRRRRALVRDKYLHSRIRLQDATEAAVHNAANRTRGVIKRTQKLIASQDAADDAVLVERVLSALGHIIDDVDALDVRACDGCVVLGGAARPGEIDAIVECAQHVRGVRDVDNRLTTASGG